MKSIKCVIVGDEAAQKTAMLDAFTDQSAGSNKYDDFEKKVKVDDVEVSLHLFDAPADADFKNYTDANVFVLCFSLVSPESLQSIEKTFAPAVKEVCPNANIILVGTNLNERNDLADQKESSSKCILQSTGEEMKEKIGAKDYIECSIDHKININRIFEQVVRSITGTKPEDQSNHKGHDKKDCLIC